MAFFSMKQRRANKRACLPTALPVDRHKLRKPAAVAHKPDSANHRTARSEYRGASASFEPLRSGCGKSDRRSLYATGSREGLCVDISSIKCYMLSRIGHVIDLRISNVNHHRIDKSRRVIKDLWVKL